jgi:hypothetical protein
VSVVDHARAKTRLVIAGTLDPEPVSLCHVAAAARSHCEQRVGRTAKPDWSPGKSHCRPHRAMRANCLPAQSSLEVKWIRRRPHTSCALNDTSGFGQVIHPSVQSQISFESAVEEGGSFSGESLQQPKCPKAQGAGALLRNRMRLIFPSRRLEVGRNQPSTGVSFSQHFRSAQSVSALRQCVHFLPPFIAHSEERRPGRRRCGEANDFGAVGIDLSGP